MSRHDGRETDGAHGHGAWLPGGYAAGRDEDGGRGRHSAGQGSGAHQRPRGSTQTSPDSDSQTGPPWEDRRRTIRHRVGLPRVVRPCRLELCKEACSRISNFMPLLFCRIQ